MHSRWSREMLLGLVNISVYICPLRTKCCVCVVLHVCMYVLYFMSRTPRTKKLIKRVWSIYLHDYSLNKNFLYMNITHTSQITDRVQEKQVLGPNLPDHTFKTTLSRTLGQIAHIQPCVQFSSVNDETARKLALESKFTMELCFVVHIAWIFYYTDSFVSFGYNDSISNVVVEITEPHKMRGWAELVNKSSLLQDGEDTTTIQRHVELLHKWIIVNNS